MNQPRLMVNGEPNPTGTGRYCPPKICYCGTCPWWAPPPPVEYEAAIARATKALASSRWDTRSDDTWIDAL